MNKRKNRRIENTATFDSTKLTFPDKVECVYVWQLSIIMGELTPGGRREHKPPLLLVDEPPFQRRATGAMQACALLTHHIVVVVAQIRVGMAIWVRVPDTRRVPDLTGTGTGMIFYPRVAPVPDPN
jgi:hypothetical protein